MSVLLIVLDAPMQSWGLRSRSTLRDTATEPTKSGMVGLLAAAQGIGRDQDEAIQQLATLRMGVRVDREGQREADFHTAAGVAKASQQPLGSPMEKHERARNRSGGHSVTSYRNYLADALFLVTLESDRTTLTTLHHALLAPRWPLYLGRRAFVPARPLVHPDPDIALQDLAIEDALASHPWCGDGRPPGGFLRTLVDAAPTTDGAELRYDRPRSFQSHDRQYEARYVLPGHVPCPPAPTNPTPPQ
ncbi:type I-E CRISPR-associated protein Cas5/CasD [Streptomyces sp. NPDC048172]|uniref:type I-E CRISPR-associated protein Cas5/CasD n=1 Tax=Streptomyces sp. NPDC048172 TaxID=3365505 RepID=UPI003710E8E3